MFSVLCSAGLHLWYLYEESDLTENIRVYKKCERCGKKVEVKERRSEARNKSKQEAA